MVELIPPMAGQKGAFIRNKTYEVDVAICKDALRGYLQATVNCKVE